MSLRLRPRVKWGGCVVGFSGGLPQFILAVKSCTMKSPCNVDANENFPPSSLLSDSIFGARAGVSVGMSLKPCVDEQGATVRLVDHSGMYADAMTKKNGSVSLLQAHLHH